MTLRPGADIVDHQLQSSVGRWDGTRVRPVEPDDYKAPPANLTGIFVILIAAALFAPMLFARRRKGAGAEDSRAIIE